MFVFNEISYDRRVLKEADALQAAGWSVTIHGIRQRRSKASVREDRTSGVVIIRHPQTVFPATPPAWNPAWRLAFKALFAFQFIFTALPALAGIRVARQVRSAFALWAWAVSASRATTQAGILTPTTLVEGSRRCLHQMPAAPALCTTVMKCSWRVGDGRRAQDLFVAPLPHSLSNRCSAAPLR